jgi:transposase
MTAQPMLPKLTIGLDLSDTSSRYCAVDAHGQVVATGRVRTTPAALAREFTRWAAGRVVLEVGTHSPWVSRLFTRLGHEVLVANARQLRLIYASEGHQCRCHARHSNERGKSTPAVTSRANGCSSPGASRMVGRSAAPSS